MAIYKCTDCGSDDIVEIRNDGEMVCRKCGLVLQSHMFDDRAPRNWDSVDYHYETIPQIFIGNDLANYDKLSRFCDILCLNKQGCESVMFVFNSFLESDRCKQHGKPKGDNMIAALATCIYIGCDRDNQKRSHEDICKITGTCMKTFHHMYGIILESIKPHDNKENQSGEHFLIRAINKIENLRNLDKTQRWTLIKTCKTIYNMASSNNTFKSKKPTKTNAAVLYISCRAMNINIKKKEVAKSLGVSIVTLTEHEKLIMEIKSRM